MSDSYRRLCDDLPRGSGAPGNFAAEPRKVKAWVAALPRANAQATEQELARALDGLLAQRLAGATDWLQAAPATRGLPVGCFGASTGGGAALVAAAARPAAIRAVVSRGGRPDLAGAALARVQAPTLLLVGGADIPVIALNQQALAQLRGVKELAIVPGATHLFEEPGALEEVARRARDWFLRYLPPDAATQPAIPPAVHPPGPAPA